MGDLLDTQAFRALQIAVSEFPKLKAAQHFVVPRSIADFADEIGASSLDDARDFRLPEAARLPAKEMTLFLESHDGACGALFALEHYGDREVVVDVFNEERSVTLFVGSYVPGGLCFANDEAVRVLGWDMVITALMNIAFTLAVINEPRVVLRRPAGCRQQRRGLQRGFGFAVDAVTRVSWDLSKPTTAKTPRDPDFHCMPLHFRRGHFHRAEAHWKGAFQRPDAIRVEDRIGWWQWYEGQLVGHPAFGTRRSVHAPEMSTGQLASRFLQRKAA